MGKTASRRLAKLKPFFDRQKLDAILLTSSANIFYLTNFLFRDPHGQEAIAVVNKNGKAVLFVPRMFQDQAKKVFDGVGVKICDKRNRLFPALVKHLRNKKVGFETYSLTVAQYNRLRQKRTCLTPLSKKFASLRQEKEEQELEKIKKAVEVTDKAFEKVVKKIKPGKTERQIAALVKQSMEDLGADSEAFPTIVASGENSAIPHWQATNKGVKNGEIILIDMGAKKDGYNSDLARTVFLGKPPSRFIKLYFIVKEAQAAAVEKAKPKMSGEALDQLVREVFKNHQVEKYFLHSTGHGLGIADHETPSLSPKAKSKITINSVITIEPGLYFSGWGGIRIEDVAMMTEKGLKFLSKAPYLTFPDTA